MKVGSLIGMASLFALACGSAPNAREDGATDTVGQAAQAPSRGPIRAIHGGATAASAVAATDTPHVRYWGGKVIKDVRVYAVYWGQDVQYQSHLNAFYNAITHSTYIDWLSE